MGKHKTYFQFPLCLLHLGDDFRGRIDKIMDYGLLYRGMRKRENDGGRDRTTVPEYCRWVEQDFSSSGQHMQHARETINAGAEAIGVTVPNESAEEKTVYAAFHANQHAEAHRYLYGPHSWVRLETGLTFRVRDERALSEREFSVLCAIYSAIGKSKFKRIRLKDIHHRAAGFKKREHLDDFLKTHRARNRALPHPLTGKTVLPLLWTEKQIRKTVSDLFALRFFAKVSTGNATYYSHRLTQGALRDAILKAKTFKAVKNLQEAEKDKLLQDAIRRIKTGAATGK